MKTVNVRFGRKGTAVSSAWREDLEVCRYDHSPVDLPARFLTTRRGARADEAGGPPYCRAAELEPALFASRATPTTIRS